MTAPSDICELDNNTVVVVYENHEIYIRHRNKGKDGMDSLEQISMDKSSFDLMVRFAKNELERLDIIELQRYRYDLDKNCPCPDHAGRSKKDGRS